MSRRHEICRLSEIPPGRRKIVQIGRRSIGIFNVDGELFAVKNRCPHQGAPLCTGTLSGTMIPSAPQQYEYGLEGRILRCPWHAWEFDIASGEILYGMDPVRVKTYQVGVEQDLIVLYL
jgi:3-phenylpropionate/trans-cinnamate dioxygenase ferredoxin subunit